ncbi:phage tail assembly chaperone [Desulfocurvibacter africanus]|uniref:phage tail assembly chaperone n=1 Tax=Desulfocurvibacter africanus TaxID=873 RepID=UPI0009DC226C|nr:phage tail assembly chaperone [Desulfocurvibacter africanus]
MHLRHSPSSCLLSLLTLIRRQASVKEGAAYRQALRDLPQQAGFPWAGPSDAARRGRVSRRKRGPNLSKPEMTRRPRVGAGLKPALTKPPLHRTRRGRPRRAASNSNCYTESR